MFIIEDNRIFLTRGDTAVIEVTLENMDKSEYVLQSGDTLIFRMKRAATKSPSEILMEKFADVTETDVTFSITPSDTELLGFGLYRYEVELVTALGEHYTVLADEEFEIGKELENHE